MNQRIFACFRFNILTTLIWSMEICKAEFIPPDCQVKDSEIGEIANCSYNGEGNQTSIYQFPGSSISNPEQIKSLDISRNQYVSASFTKFRNLLELCARNVTFLDEKYGTDFEYDVANLKKLEEIDLSGSIFYNKTELELRWPKQLFKINLANMGLNEILGLEVLLYLDDLDFSSNQLKTLPKLNGKSPIVTINLNNNPIDSITVEQIAPLCLLTTFYLDIKGGSFNSQSNYEGCKLLEQWLVKYGIASGSFSCGETPVGYSQTNYEFSAEATTARNDCLEARSRSVYDLILFAVIIALVFPVLYYGNEAFNRYERRKRASSDSSERRNRENRSTTVSSDFEVEST